MKQIFLDLFIYQIYLFKKNRISEDLKGAYTFYTIGNI